MRNTTYVLIALAVIVILIFLKRRGGASISRDLLQQAIARDEHMLLLDVRSPEEFESGRVPGAVNVPLDRVQSAPHETADDKSMRIVVYCERGPRAFMAQGALKKAGFKNVVHLSGDMSGWRSSGLPVEK
jgi:rhodanese-related sulfurtransferase